MGKRRFVLPAVLRALGYRNFRLFITGQFVSLVGTWMQNVAQSWLIYRLTGSSLLLGSLGFVSQIPIFLLAPVGGAVADRLDRRRVVISTQVAMMLLAFVLGILTLTGWVKIWHVLVLSALLGAVNAFDIPARQSFFVEMVGRQDLINAIALNSSVFNGARIIGPAIAGVLIAAIGEGWCFMANAASYLAVIAGLIMIQTAPRPLPRPSSTAWSDMTQGFVFVWRTGPIRALLGLLGFASLIGMPYTVLLPIFAARVLQGGATTLGLLLGATGIGALAGALRIAVREHARGLGRWVAISCACFGAGLIIFSFSRWLWLSVAVLTPIGFAMMVQMGSSNTLIQTIVPDHLRGRVMAVYSMMLLGMAPFGSLLAGAIAQRIGAPLTVAMGGAGCLVGAAIFWKQWPALQLVARQLVVAHPAISAKSSEQTTAALRMDPSMTCTDADEEL